MIKLLAFATVLFSSVTVFEQIPDFETSEDCLDWFLLSWNQLNGKSACFGNAHVSGSSSEGFLDLEWFEVRFNDRSNHKYYRYIESRRTYANGEQADLWEKSLNRGKEWKWSLGDFSKEMATVQAPEFDEKGDQIGGLRTSMKTPDVCALSVVTGSVFESSFGSHNDVDKMFDQLKLKIEETIVDGEKLQGFYHGGGKYAVEILFDKSFGGMPVSSRGYFRNNNEKGMPDRSFFPLVNFDSKTKWEEIGKGGSFAPVEITNFVQRLSSKSKNSKVVEIRAAWEIDGIEASLFSDDSFEKNRSGKGPLFGLRKTLKSKLENSERERVGK